MMDLMLNRTAKALLQEQAPALMQRVPPLFTTTQAPSLSAIMTLRRVMDLLRMPTDAAGLARLNDSLSGIEITDEDKDARCARYDNDSPRLTLSDAPVQVLIFDKVNGYDHGPVTAAATEAIRDIAEAAGWGVAVTGKGGAFTSGTLEKFDVVVWNNVSGDVLTLAQREAFANYIRGGGGYLGIHGSGGDFIYLWDWYVNELLGAQFIGHTMDPHFQEASILVEKAPSGIGRDLSPGWTMNDEWYSFANNPRLGGASVVATLDERSYRPEMSGLDLRMGDDHPIAWGRCVGDGRAFYTGIGHRPEAYAVTENLRLLRDALNWARGGGQTRCRSGEEAAD